VVAEVVGIGALRIYGARGVAGAVDTNAPVAAIPAERALDRGGGVEIAKPVDAPVTRPAFIAGAACTVAHHVDAHAATALAVVFAVHQPTAFTAAVGFAIGGRAGVRDCRIGVDRARIGPIDHDG